MKLVWKSLLILLVFSFTFGCVFIIYYFSNINTGTSINICIPLKSHFIVKATSPTGGLIELNYDRTHKSYHIEGRFIKNLLVSGDTTDLEILIKTRDSSIIVHSKNLLKDEKEDYYVNPSVYPKYSLTSKIKDISKIDLNNLLYLRMQMYFKIFIKYLLIFVLFLIPLVCIQVIIVNYHKIRILITTFFHETGKFIRKKKYQLIFPFLLALIPGTVYLFYDQAVLRFLNIDAKTFIFIYWVIFSPLSFFLFFIKSLKINKWFWISFALIFIANYFIIFPNVYIYGVRFRDDISHFFVKAHQYNLYDDLFTPNAGYLSVLPSLIPFIIYKVLGIRQYFPETIQFVALLCNTAVFAAFNLRIFRSILADDRQRFLVSLLLGIIRLALPMFLFMHELAFIAAIYFWLSIFRINSLSKTGFVFLVSVYVLFIFSKPIYIIFIPLLIFLFVAGKKLKNKRYIISSLIWLFAILIQIAVVLLDNSNNSIQISHNGLGTNYLDDFNLDSLPFIKSFFYGTYVHIRVLYTLFIPYLASGWWQIFVNAVLFCLVVSINVFLLIRFFKHRSTLDLVFLTGNFLSILSAVLFVKVVSIPNLMVETQSILQLNFGKLLQCDYVVPYHRYMTLGFLPIAASIFYTIYLLLKRKKKFLTVVITILIILMLTGRYFQFYSLIKKTEANTPGLLIKPKVSLWRENLNLIFNYPDNFYIPYQGYPIQTECINYNIDRITDVLPNNYWTIYIDSLPYDTRKWEVIELISEYDTNLNHRLAYAKLTTCQNDTVFVKPFHPVTPDYYFIIFRFDNYLQIKQINFVDKNKNVITISKPIRLIGKYE